jgi:exodeoxyribonuclease-5
MKKSNINKIKNWYENPTYTFIISGFAGTGKTTLARDIPELLDIKWSTAFLAPTGKAARVLHEYASTIHSYLYEPIFNPVTKKITFVKKQINSFHEKLLIVDEISMVNKELMNDLLSLNIPIIGLGDPAQLPPIQGNTQILNKPDIFLKKVWRTDGGILSYATDIRLSKKTKSRYKDVSFKKRFYKDIKLYNEDSIVICRFNKTRNSLNHKIRREVYGYKELIEPGEKMIILKNNRDSGLMNGSIVIVNDIININTDENVAEILVTDENDYKQAIEIDIDIIRGIEDKPKRFSKKENIHEIDYGYAITCHKAQGSEYDTVFVINQGDWFDDHQKWLYTAITRAKNKLYMYF